MDLNKILGYTSKRLLFVIEVIFLTNLRKNIIKFFLKVGCVKNLVCRIVVFYSLVRGIVVFYSLTLEGRGIRCMLEGRGIRCMHIYPILEIYVI